MTENIITSRPFGSFNTPFLDYHFSYRVFFLDSFLDSFPVSFPVSFCQKQ